jgi:hypothetical protein
LLEFLGLHGGIAREVREIDLTQLVIQMDGRLGFFNTENEPGRESKMGLVGLVIMGIILGAAGMQFLRSSKPELVERTEDSITRFVKSIWLSKSDAKKPKEK